MLIYVICGIILPTIKTIGGFIMIPKKIDSATANEIRTILSKLDIKNPRITIDFDKQTIELEDDEYSVDDLLDSAGALSPERVKELREDISKMREDWD
jgi:hypothetical protein